MSENSTEGPAGTETQQTPAPWGENFEPEKAWKLIQDLRSDKEKLAKRPVLTPEAQAKLTEYERLEQASQTELDRQKSETTRWQTETERWRSEAMTSRIAALATDFADPSDAASALDSSKYLDAGGVIDDAAIKADLAALLERKPHWRRPDGTPAGPRTPAPNGAQGSSANGPTGTPADQFGAILRANLSQ